MYCISNMCFLCLTYEDAVNFIVLQHAGNELVQQVKFILPEIQISEPRLPLPICSTCRRALDSFHKFKRLCLDNSCRYNGYINKLLNPNGNSKRKFGELEEKVSENIQLTNLKEERNDDFNIVELNAEENLVEDGIYIVEEKFSLSEDNRNLLYQEIVEKETESNNVQDQNVKFGNKIIVEEIQSSNQKVIPNENTLLSNLKGGGNIDSNLEKVYLGETLVSDGIDIIEMYVPNDNAHPCYPQILEKETKPYNVLDCDGNSSDVNQINKDKIQYNQKELRIGENKLLSNGKEEENIVSTNEEPEGSTELYDQQILKKRTKVNSSKDLKCSVCKKMFVGTTNLYKHIKMVHANVKERKCLICNKMFKSNWSLTCHMKVHGGIRDFKCSVCNKMFSLNSVLRRHMTIHTDVQNYNVQQIKITENKLLTNQETVRNIDINIVEQNAEENLVKDRNTKETLSLSDDGTNFLYPNTSKETEQDCHRNISSVDNIIQNEIHSSKQNISQCQTINYNCCVCNEMFPEKLLLYHHMYNEHAIVEDKKCLICGKAKFANIANFYLHMKDHAGITNLKCSVYTAVKKFKCSLCYNMFRQESQLKAHMDIHARSDINGRLNI